MAILFRIPLFWLAFGTLLLFLYGSAYVGDGVRANSYWMIFKGVLLFLMSLYVGFITLRWFWRYLKAIVT